MNVSAETQMEIAKAAPPKADGGPAPERDVTFTVRLPRSLAIKLEAWATSKGMTRAMAIRGLVQAAVGR
jgi:hypothetical protein